MLRIEIDVKGSALLCNNRVGVRTIDFLIDGGKITEHDGRSRREAVREGGGGREIRTGVLYVSYNWLTVQTMPRA